MPRVLILGRIHAAGRALLERSAIEIEDLAEAEVDRLPSVIQAADAVLLRTAPLSRQAIEAATNLKVVSRHGVGYDNVDLDALNERGIPLTVVGPVNAISVAEHSFYLLLALMKHGLLQDRAVRNGGWASRDNLAASELFDKTLLIIGYGRIGREVAVRARAFGMKVIAHDPFLEATGAGPEVRLAHDLDSALAEADAVTLHVPLTPQTRNLLNAPRLRLMKPSAILVCTARGGLIDEVALFDALQSGRLAGAGLDVFGEEPPSTDHPLFKLDNVALSPHSAALTLECAMRMSVISAQNCLDAFNDRLNPALVVNPQVLDRGRR